MDRDAFRRDTMLREIEAFFKLITVNLRLLEKTTGIWPRILFQYRNRTRKPPVDVCRDILHNLREQACNTYRMSAQSFRKSIYAGRHSCVKCDPLNKFDKTLKGNSPYKKQSRKLCKVCKRYMIHKISEARIYIDQGTGSYIYVDQRGKRWYAAVCNKCHNDKQTSKRVTLNG